jgi:TatD DNase family protein
MNQQPLIFDTHAHYDDSRFATDRENFISNPESFGALGFVNVGTDLNSSNLGLSYTKKHKNVYCSIGVHPSCIPGLPRAYLTTLEGLAHNEKVVAIGEIGLDYHYNPHSKSEQAQRFEEQLELASTLNLPVIIHSRDALDDTIAILKSKRPKQFVVHCFSYDLKTAKQILELGGFLGVTGIITFKNSKSTREVLQTIPFSRVLIETDCPYMAPEPFRSKRCDSGMLSVIAQAIANQKQLPLREVVDTLNANARKFFFKAS